LCHSANPVFGWVFLRNSLMNCMPGWD
jgi:hypothetical protein